MARLNIAQNNFLQGEISPLLLGRFDLAQLYNSGCYQLKNFITFIQGGIKKRNGTKFMAEADDPTSVVRLIPFEFSETESYILEFGDEYIRFFTGGGIVLDGTTPYKITSPYSAEHISTIKFVQAADTFYLVHPQYPIKKLVRNDVTDWTIADADIVNGPYLDENITDITIEPSALTGDITLTASPSASGMFNSFHVGSVWKLNAPKSENETLTAAGWTDAMELDKGDSITVSAKGVSWSAIVSVQKSVDDGTSWSDVYISTSNFALQITELDNDDTFYRIGIDTGDYTSGTVTVKMENLDAWGYCKVTDYVSKSEVEATVLKDLPSLTATTKWSEGAWSAYRGYPGAVAFFEQRLLLAGTEYEPQDVWGSKVNDYENFKTGTLSTDAYNYTLVSNALNNILWLLENRVLHAGTLGGEWKFGYKDEPTTPTSVDAKNQTADGSANIQAIVINSNVLFIEKGKRRLRSKVYDYNIDGYKSYDISYKAEHLFKDGIVDMVFQKGKTPVIWLVTSTGKLIGVTYLPQNDTISYHQHDTQGFFESVAVIPNDTTSTDELWVVVKRTINGVDTRYIEQFQDNDIEELDDMYYMDSGISYDQEGVPATTFVGADHLSGMSCVVLADGAVLPNVTVSPSGSFEISTESDKVTIGLGYESNMLTMPFVPNIEQGTSQGKPKALWKVNVQLHDTIGIKIGSTIENAEIIPFRSSDDNMNEGLPLFTGLKELEFIEGFEVTQQISVVSDQPLPCNVLSLAPVFYASSS